MAIADLERSLENLKLERDAIVLYDTLASIERDPRRSAAFRTIAGNERRHAEIWANRLREQGATVPPPGRPRARVRLIMRLARLFGTHAVRDLVQALEGDEEATYTEQSSPEVAAIAADEREHAEIWKRLSAREQDAASRGAAADGIAGAPGAMASGAATGIAMVGGGPATIAAGTGSRVNSAAVTAAEPDAFRPVRIVPIDVAKRERWHRTGQSGTLRAVIFGVSDGLVSNLSLVMGVVGAASEQPKFILLAGIAGLLAGSFSMAAGEYISMKAQRELYERQIALERSEMEAMPAEEEAELAEIYQGKGFTADEAARIAHRIFQDPKAALDALVREELGLDPTQLGSPWGAAGGSFVAFAVGAAVPVLPYLFGGGTTIFALSLGLSLVALFAVGAGVSLLTGRGMLFTATRQIAIGSAAAAVTFLVGHVIGVSVS